VVGLDCAGWVGPVVCMVGEGGPAGGLPDGECDGGVEGKAGGGGL